MENFKAAVYIMKNHIDLAVFLLPQMLVKANISQKYKDTFG